MECPFKELEGVPHEDLEDDTVPLPTVGKPVKPPLPVPAPPTAVPLPVYAPAWRNWANPPRPPYFDAVREELEGLPPYQEPYRIEEPYEPPPRRQKIHEPVYGGDTVGRTVNEGARNVPERYNARERAQISEEATARTWQQGFERYNAREWPVTQPRRTTPRHELIDAPVVTQPRRARGRRLGPVERPRVPSPFQGEQGED